jgi:hypothetical protein
MPDQRTAEGDRRHRIPPFGFIDTDRNCRQPQRRQMGVLPAPEKEFRFFSTDSLAGEAISKFYACSDGSNPVA